MTSQQSISKPGRIGISYEQVASECESILVRGQRPTQRLLISLLGGSASTIQGHLNKWKENRSDKATPPVALSEQMQRALLSEISRINSDTVHDIKNQLSDTIGDLEALTSECQKLNNEIEVLQNEKAELNISCQIQSKEISQLRIEKIEIENEILKERAIGMNLAIKITTAETRLEVLAKSENENHQLKQQLDEMRELLSSTNIRFAIVEKTLADCQEKNVESSERISSLNSQVADQGKTIELRTKELFSSDSRVEAANARLESAARELSNAKENIATLRQSERVAVETAAELRGQLQILKLPKPVLKKKDSNQDTKETK
ncbi:hypothetical protein JAB4_059560 (plasmid) [Janthinobacterium sp. HH102]|uniref:DNA-binding protein n=1 Tax=Janthinobacterium sp. HH102 TaxID=1537274 RepID=UPI000893283B|nr:DNA-binding protein [Janthinobacterium sp. HH102]QOU76456.1 hypothetical protein JAB4_059560 [Janthinobacterium sp. HH102]